MTREKSAESRVSTALPRSLYERLQEQATRQRRSVAAQLALIVEAWLEEREWVDSGAGKAGQSD